MDGDDQYIKQLEEIFNSFCFQDETTLKEGQLVELCKKLSLEDDCIDRLFVLAFSDKDHSSIDFNHFCECFVSALSETTDQVTSDPEDYHGDEVAVETEVQPRLVRKGRKYGRKTAPQDTLDDARIRDETFHGRAVESELWAGDMATSSDDAIDVRHLDGDKAYYESTSPFNAHDDGDYFEASGVGSSSSLHGVSNKTQKNLQLSNGFLDPQNDSVILFHESPGCNLFSSLELDDSGCVEVGHLIEMWRRGGIADPGLILQGCGVNHHDERDMIDSYELSSTLEKEALAVLSSLPATNDISVSGVVACGLLAAYKHHSLHLESQADHYRRKADKIQEDLDRSEVRNTKMIAEVDDRYLSIDEHSERLVAGVERKWEKKMTAAQREFHREREAIMLQSQMEREELTKEVGLLRDNESMLRRKLNVLSSENKELAKEAIQLSEKLSDAEKDAERLRKDLECLLVAKTGDLSDPMSTSQEEKFAMIIKDYETQQRELMDRNDELAVEIEKVRAKLRRQESRDHDNQDLYSETIMTSPKRKKASRRKSNQTDWDEKDSLSLDDDLNGLCHPKSKSLSLDKSPYNVARMTEFARMSELEHLVEDFRNSKRETLDSLATEKAAMRMDMEKEFQMKLEAERSKLHSYHDNKAMEEQQAMTMQLLKEMTQQKDELEAKYEELKEHMDKETSSGHKEMADLCREFAKEKAELVAQHDEKLQQLSDDVTNARQKLEEERSAIQRLEDQLKFERIQHKEALLAHQEIIDKFEKSTSSRNNEVDIDKLKEISLKHDEEVARLKRDHAAALESVKRNAENKLDELLAEKQQSLDNTSMCSDLERLQESISAERMVMHERMHEMREAFEREAVELRQLLDCDKAKLRKQLSEEVATLRQRMAEETEREMKRKRQIMEEEEAEMLRKKKAETERREDNAAVLQEVEILKIRNRDLEELLSQSTSSLREQEEAWKKKEETKWSENFLVRRIEETKKLSVEKELENKSLRKQLDDVRKRCEQQELSTSSLRTRDETQEAEIRSLTSEREQLCEKVRTLERDYDATKVENAGLAAKLRHLEDRGAPIPNPRRKVGRQEKFKEKESENKKTNEKKALELESADVKKKLQEENQRMKTEIDDLRAKLSQQLPSDVIVSLHDDSDVTDDADNDDVSRRTRRRLEQTRMQLSHQMKRMKDLYSKLSKTELLVKDLYCENAHLMRGLQVTEARQKEAERKLVDEMDKNSALGRLLREICPTVT